jgi:hypothetical protein
MQKSTLYYIFVKNKLVLINIKCIYEIIMDFLEKISVSH